MTPPFFFAYWGRPGKPFRPQRSKCIGLCRTWAAKRSTLNITWTRAYAFSTPLWPRIRREAKSTERRPRHCSATRSRIPTLLDLIATFPDRLGEQNIFQADYHYPSRKSEDIYQIDETALAAGLVQEASNRDRTYSAASAANDARAVAIIMRLRRGGARRNLSGCGHVFVSRNPVLQGVAKRYVARNVEGYEGDAIPPVLTLGQITTVAWLATARALAPQRVTKELLATCYNAVRPSLAWTQQFSKALDKFRAENPGFVESRANAALFLQAARNAARDESPKPTRSSEEGKCCSAFHGCGRRGRRKGERTGRRNCSARRRGKSQGRGGTTGRGGSPERAGPRDRGTTISDSATGRRAGI